jgi:hypothetical protein
LLILKADPYGDPNDHLNCIIINELYQTASRIECRTQSPSIRFYDINEYSVYVSTNRRGDKSSSIVDFAKYASFDANNQFIFRYTEPEIYSIEPRKGIKSGGTLLKIVGKNLACGSDVNVKFLMNSGICKIVNTTSHKQRAEFSTQSSYSLIDDLERRNQLDLDELYCRTPAYNQNEWTGQKANTQTSLQIKIDDYVQVLNSSKFRFEYVDDPKIVSIDPDSGIMSGGLFMNVKGKGFDSLQATHLILSSVPFSSAMSRVNSAEIGYDIENIKNINIFKSVRTLFIAV